MNNSKPEFFKIIKFGEDTTKEATCNEVIAMYEPFIDNISYKYSIFAKEKYFKHSFYFEVDDMKQIAYMGVIKAFEDYDYSKGFLFFTYMKLSVEYRFKKYVRDTAKLRAVVNEYDVKTEYLDKSIQIDQDSAEIKLSDIIPDNFSPIDDFIEKDNIESLLSILSKKERDIVTLNILERKKQRDIGIIYNISQVTVSRIITKACKKMKKKILEDEGEIIKMIKIKPTTEEAIKYLKENASKEFSFSKGTQDYAKSLGLSFTTMLTILQKSDEYEDVKSLYKDTSKTYNPHKDNKPNKTILDIVSNDILGKEITTANEVKAEIEQELESEERAPISINNKLQRLIDINNIEIKADENISIKVIDNKCEFYLHGMCFNEEEISDLKNNVDKLLEIYNIVK